MTSCHSNDPSSLVALGRMEALEGPQRFISVGGALRFPSMIARQLCLLHATSTYFHPAPSTLQLIIYPALPMLQLIFQHLSSELDRTVTTSHWSTGISIALGVHITDIGPSPPRVSIEHTISFH